MTETQFWWATIHGHDRPEVVRVFFKDGRPRVVSRAGLEADIWASEFIALNVRLIERVLPAGRAAAVVAKLQEAFDIRDEGVWVTGRKIAELLQGESRS